MAERGVSDVIGFVLIFALITSTVGLVYTFGFTGLQDARDDERLANTERVFDILADNVADLHQRGAPSRATEIKLADATLGYGSETTLTVEVTNVGSPAPTYSTSLDPIVYEQRNSPVRLVYENGAVFRERRGESGTVVRRPGSVFREDGGTKTAVISFVQTRQSGTAATGGSTTVRIQTEKAGTGVFGVHRSPTSANSDVDGDGTNEYEVTYTVETTPVRATMWEESLERRISWRPDACSVSGGDVTCTFGVERLSVTVVRVDVSFS